MNTKEKLRAVIFILIILIGTFLIIIGIKGGNIGNYVILSSCGAALLGTGISLLINSLLKDELTEFKKYLFSQQHFGSKEIEAESCSGKWYFYFVSKKNEERIWLYDKLDLKLNRKLRLLYSSVSTPDKQGKKKKYLVNAGVRSDRLILIGCPNIGKEPHYVTVIKGAAVEHFDICCGVQFQQTWDGDTSISPVLMSRRQFVKVSKNSGIDSESQKKLDTIWTKESSLQRIDCLIKDS